MQKLDFNQLIINVTIIIFCLMPSLLFAEERSTPFSKGEFAKPDFMSGLHTAQFKALHESSSGIFYIEGINNIFSGESEGGNSDCRKLVRFELTSKIKSKRLKMRGLSGGYDSSNRGILNILRDMNTLKKSILKQGSNYRKRIHYDGSLMTAGRKDAIILAKKYGCKSKIVKNVYENMVDFAYERYDFNTGYSEKKGIGGVIYACTTSAKNEGGDKKMSEEICLCMANEIQETQPSENNITWLIANYKSGAGLSRLMKKSRGLGEKISQCLYKVPTTN